MKVKLLSKWVINIIPMSWEKIIKSDFLRVMDPVEIKIKLMKFTSHIIYQKEWSINFLYCFFFRVT